LGLGRSAFPPLHDQKWLLMTGLERAAAQLLLLVPQAAMHFVE
jgi:hypothetical protein